MIDKDKAAQKGIKILDSTKDSNPLGEMLKIHFPQTIKEGQVNLNVIAALLGKDISNMQGYELTFTGKGLANALYTTPCQKVLKHKETFCYSEGARTTEESQNQSHEAQTLKSVVGVEGEFEREEGATSQFKPLRPFIKEDSNNKEVLTFSNLGNTTQNTIIIGDNLDTLKLFKSAYSEKIKMIYIDPPYNTGNDDFIYPDDFRADYKAILREVGLLEIDENENEVESETLQFFRNITGSKSHSGWLCFMLPRLKLARDLLREDGVIFISIDDNEQANLKLLCDEIFGEENSKASFVWRKTHTQTNIGDFARVKEYILCYAKDINATLFNNIPLTNLEEYRYEDEGGKFRRVNLIDSTRGRYEYDIKNPSGEIVSGKWMKAKEEILEMINNNEVYWAGKTPYGKNYLHNMQQKGQIANDFLGIEYGSNQRATMRLDKLMDGKRVFDFSKPLELINHFLRLSTSTDSSDIILDFFAGSGTTAQAVMELNAEDKGNRECILVQLDEPINKEKSKTAYDFCKNELKSKKPTISDITIERVKRAAKKINANMCLNVFSLESKPELLSDENSLKLETNANLSALDKAINLALSAGKTLSQTLQVVIEGKLYKCEDSYFCIQCDKKVLETLAKTSDEYIYLDGFADIDLEHFLNLDAQFKERLNIVY